MHLDAPSNIIQHVSEFAVRPFFLRGFLRAPPNVKEELMKKNFRWIICMVLAGLFMVPAALITPCQDGNPAAAPSKAVKEQHRREAQDQRHRLKQRRQDLRAEVRQSGHAKPPKAERHQTRKVRNQAKSQNPDLRRAQKNSRDRRPARPQVRTN